jgi:four helix bundle protein
MGWLKDQPCRASGSVVLNIAEAYGRTGNARRNHLRIAYGSVAEVTAGLDVLGGQPELQHMCRRIGAMLASLNRR